jgi:hypothetical protein
METTQQTTVQSGYPGGGSERRAAVEKTLAGSYGIAAVAGLAVLVLAILALVGIIPIALTGGAVIAGGLAFLIEGAGLAARARQLLRAGEGTEVDPSAIGGGVSIQLLAGLAGVTLGILALLGIEPILLLGSAVIVFGIALLIGTLAIRETAGIAGIGGGRAEQSQMLHQTIQTSNGARVFVGVASLALGVLTVIGIGPALVLTQIGLLAVGVILLLSGSAMGARFGMAT